MAGISIKVRWFLSALMLFELAYRSSYGMFDSFFYVLLLLTLVGFNLYTVRMLRRNSTISVQWISTMCAIEIAVISGAVALQGGFHDNLCHLFYYPVLAGCAALFTSLRLNLAIVTTVSAIYSALALYIGDGLAVHELEEKTLLARIGAMFVIVVVTNLACNIERRRFNETTEREQALQRERAELSHSIHDSTAQSIYMIGLGLETVKSLAGKSDPGLSAALESTADTVRSAAWELRHPINVGGIFKGMELTRTLRSHVTTFNNITSVPAEMTVSGVEPPLPIEIKSRLFSIAHNALTNAYRHSDASRVSIEPGLL